MKCNGLGYLDKKTSERMLIVLKQLSDGAWCRSDEIWGFRITPPRVGQFYRRMVDVGLLTRKPIRHAGASRSGYEYKITRYGQRAVKRMNGHHYAMDEAAEFLKTFFSENPINP